MCNSRVCEIKMIRKFFYICIYDSHTDMSNNTELNFYLITASSSGIQYNAKYGTYHHCVVMAPNEETALVTHPNGYTKLFKLREQERDWPSLEEKEYLNIVKMGCVDKDFFENHIDSTIYESRMKKGCGYVVSFVFNGDT